MVEVSLDEIVAMDWGSLAPDGMPVIRRWARWSAETLMLEVRTMQTTYRSSMQAPKWRELPNVIDSSQDGYLALVRSWSWPYPFISPVTLQYYGGTLRVELPVWSGYSLAPGTVPGDEVTVLGPRPRWHDTLSETRRRYYNEVRSAASRSGVPDDLAGRVHWLLWLFGLDGSDRSGDMPYDRENAWMLDLIHPSPDDNRLLFCPSRPNDVVRKPVYSRISTVLKTLQRKIGLQLPWTIEELSYAWSEVVPEKIERYSFDLLSGQGIVDAYHDENGPISCMSETDFVRWYADNPDSVSLLKVTERTTGRFARALVWTTTEGQKVLDRVYPTDGGDLSMAAMRYAEEQGWEIERFEKPYDVTMKPSQHGYPYMDTFSRADRYRGGVITITNRDEGRYSFSCTCGGINDFVSDSHICWSDGSWTRY